MGAEVTVGAGKTEHNVLPIEVFKEIKKNLIKSRKKMESLCHILRRNKVKMTARVREQLQLNDHKLDDSYETVKIKTKKEKTKRRGCNRSNSKEERQEECQTH